MTGSSAVISWWTNETTTGSVAIDGRTVTDPAGSAASRSLRHRASAGHRLPLHSDKCWHYRVWHLPYSGDAGPDIQFRHDRRLRRWRTGSNGKRCQHQGSWHGLHPNRGDNVYPSSGLPDPNFATTYSDFDQRLFKPFGATIKEQAFHPANGNKEYYGDGQWWDAFPCMAATTVGTATTGATRTFFVLDTEVPYSPGTEQYAFAEADLQGSQNAKWRIVVTHAPPYSSSSAGASSEGVQAHLVPLFQAQNVHLVASGNSHNYERTYPDAERRPGDR